MSVLYVLFSYKPLVEEEYVSYLIHCRLDSGYLINTCKLTINIYLFDLWNFSGNYILVFCHSLGVLYWQYTHCFIRCFEYFSVQVGPLDLSLVCQWLPVVQLLPYPVTASSFGAVYHNNLDYFISLIHSTVSCGIRLQILL